MSTFSTTSTDKYSDFSLVSGGLIYSVMQKIQKRLPGPNSLLNQAIIMAIITWLPLCLFSIYYEIIQGNTGEISFFADITMYVRFLFVVPFLILIERTIDNSFLQFVKNTENIIKPIHEKSFAKLTKLIDKLTDSIWPETIMLVIIYAYMLLNWKNLELFNSGEFFIVNSATGALAPGGWYLILIAMPIYQLLLFRWLWRFLVWVYTILRFSRFHFRLEALHADQMAGLAYLNFVPLYFSLLAMAPTAMVSAEMATDIYYHGANLTDYSYYIIFYVALVTIVIYSPLLAYIPLLAKTKERGVELFGQLLIKHNNDYMEKWIYQPSSKNEPILGSMDNSSLSDINGSYTAAGTMKLVPINLKMISTSVFLLVLPFIPLVFTMYAPVDLFKDIVQSVLN